MYDTDKKKDILCFIFDGEISYVLGTKIEMYLLLYETSCYKKSRVRLHN